MSCQWQKYSTKDVTNKRRFPGVYSLWRNYRNRNSYQWQQCYTIDRLHKRNYHIRSSIIYVLPQPSYFIKQKRRVCFFLGKNDSHVFIDRIKNDLFIKANNRSLARSDITRSLPPEVKVDVIKKSLFITLNLTYISYKRPLLRLLQFPNKQTFYFFFWINEWWK